MPIFNTYGPRMHPFDGRVISNFIRQALEGEDITIFGDGRQTRSFCYRDDLLEGLIRMMDAPDDFCGPVNLGNPDEFTIRELADIVIELTGSARSWSSVPSRPTIPPSAGPIFHSPGTAGLATDGSLARGLAKTIDWFRSIDLTDYRPPTPIIERQGFRRGGFSRPFAIEDD